MTRMTEAQRDLLLRIEGEGRVYVRGHSLVTATALKRKGLVEIRSDGVPYTKGWRRYAVPKGQA
jgi:hypothetical protein